MNIEVIVNVVENGVYKNYQKHWQKFPIFLIMIQEKTNYPKGVLNLSLFRVFRDDKVTAERAYNIKIRLAEVAK